MSERVQPASSGLFDSASRLLCGLLAMAQTRLELLSVDLSLTQQHLVSLILLAICALFALLVGTVLATLLLVLAYWETHRLLLLAVLSVAYLGFGGVLALVAIQRARHMPRVFASSIAELAKDRQQERALP